MAGSAFDLILGFDQSKGTAAVVTMVVGSI
jgi:hypothetical protein